MNVWNIALKGSFLLKWYIVFFENALNAIIAEILALHWKYLQWNINIEKNFKFKTNWQNSSLKYRRNVTPMMREYFMPFEYSQEDISYKRFANKSVSIMLMTDPFSVEYR